MCARALAILPVLAFELSAIPKSPLPNDLIIFRTIINTQMFELHLATIIIFLFPALHMYRIIGKRTEGWVGRKGK